ncbi:hypothetical protein G7046_g4311 [Stylonectria norvegica]|nr:hypothetical protein G7046_g4311 [Stylonectria norvegica]
MPNTVITSQSPSDKDSRERHPWSLALRGCRREPHRTGTGRIVIHAGLIRDAPRNPLEEIVIFPVDESFLGLTLGPPAQGSSAKVQPPGLGTLPTGHVQGMIHGSVAILDTAIAAPHRRQKEVVLARGDRNERQRPVWWTSREGGRKKEICRPRPSQPSPIKVNKLVGEQRRDKNRKRKLSMASLASIGLGGDSGQFSGGSARGDHDRPPHTHSQPVTSAAPYRELAAKTCGGGPSGAFWGSLKHAPGPPACLARLLARLARPPARIPKLFLHFSRIVFVALEPDVRHASGDLVVLHHGPRTMDHHRNAGLAGHGTTNERHD